MSNHDHGGYCFEDLYEQQSASLSRTISEADIALFAGISGDHNPVHLDAEYAADSRFGERIAHGMLVAGQISAVLGMRLPGPGSIYVSQSLRFRAPVRLGDTVRAEVRVLELDAERARATLETNCYVGEQIVISGEAVALVPRRNDG